MADAVLPSPTLSSPRERVWWLFGPSVDVAVFLGSALLSAIALLLGYHYGLIQRDSSPEWTWITAVLLVDVAHVWSTGFRVYFDPAEVRRRPLLYVGTPVLCWVIGMALYAVGYQVFWRAMAYLAVWHFVRQQYGWVALYRAKLGETEVWGRRFDILTIHLATLYPLVHWHAHLPRHFWWFVEKDFAHLSGAALLASLLAPIYWICMVAYAVRAVYLWKVGRANPGKDMVVATTAWCWYVGIVALNSDYAFTVTNVLIHGIPYMALVYFWQQRRHGAALPGEARAWGVWPFLVTLWALAYCEEMFWDRAVWRERPYLFGSSWQLSDWQVAIVPLLAVPQLTHYVLDGFIWKRRTNPDVNQVVLKSEPEAPL